jgi:flagellar motor switch protein FliN/FliY
LLEEARARGERVTLGRIDTLHGAIIERIARGEGTYLSVESEGERMLVHAPAAACERLAALLGAHGIACPVITLTEALDHLARATRVALLPLEVDGVAVRVFLTPDVTRRRALHVRHALASALPIDVTLVRALTNLRIRDLGSLEIGDAITLDHVMEEGTLLGRLPGTGADLALRLSEGHALYAGPAARPSAPAPYMENTMEEDDVALAPFEDVEVEVTLDVGQTRLTLAELAALREGTVLVPNVKNTDRVTLRVNGRAIGRGTLVRVEGELAVRVDALAGSERGAQ